MLKEFVDNFDVSVLLPILGLCLFGYWLMKTSLGRRALVDSAPRRNMMPPALPLGFFLLWCLTVYAAGTIVNSLITTLAEHMQVLVQTIVQAIINVTFTVGALILVRNYFARRLKGFGMDFKKAPRDFFCAFVYLFAGWPVVLAALQATFLVGRMIYGGDYQIERHEELELIQTYTQVSIQAAILISGAIITPFFEEVFFRGLIQSTIRSYTIRPWLAIGVTSAFFAMFHPPAHRPAVFVLGMLLGYAYEKSGSLFRPMFIHALFNGLTIIIAMSRS